MDIDLDRIQVKDPDTFIAFWVLYMEDFKNRGLSWSGHCMYGFLELFPESIFETIENYNESPSTLSWESLAEIFKKFRLLQMET